MIHNPHLNVDMHVPCPRGREPQAVEITGVRTALAAAGSRIVSFGPTHRALAREAFLRNARYGLTVTFGTAEAKHLDKGTKRGVSRREFIHTGVAGTTALVGASRMAGASPTG